MLINETTVPKPGLPDGRALLKVDYFNGVASNELAHRTFRCKRDRSGGEKLARFRLWCTTQEELTAEKMNAHFLWSAGKEAYDLIQGTSQLPS